MKDQRIIIVIDARMINTSGIGRYLSSLIDSLQKKYDNLILLGKKQNIIEQPWFKKSTSIIEFSSNIYSIKEQFEFIMKIPTCDIFISPHYNIPILGWKMKKQLTFFPDVNHLALGGTLSLSKRWYAKLLYNLGAWRSDVIITISNFSKNEILKHLKVRPKKLVVAKCGTDVDKLKKLSEKNRISNQGLSNIIYILYVGNIKPHKNLHRALLAFEKVQKNNTELKFYIVGKRDGFITGDKDIFDLLECNPTLKDNVRFTGYINDMELVDYYKYSQALLFPSLYEGFGLPPLEAMALDCPVITSKVSSMPEICGNAAIYCNPYDVEDIAYQIKQVLVNETLKAELRRNGEQKVQEYTWERFNKNVLKEIEILLKT
ncbi:Glycosyltransferase involved in cell wall bisynthesis [Reichenbachiella faecimaris]|uniref:Glycosyltransferase involved in cell wall bisynthesis n=1 Tax=Reichenbachiella faecimaris TaxID=692418 RepID=A0A1W2GCY8_REIFA|nr:glycosyltransferase family 1 protein [Reichenbachiella faecimaris]SMD34374.1 Glycosyltransferase involved in cell wall bisynthesis [Reichenbachiella faecimaris]